MPARPGISYRDPTEHVTLHIEMEEEAAPKETPKETPKGPAQKVLLLDDRDDFREILCEHLTSRFYHVTSVRSGVEGLHEVVKSPFDLIICDMMMPQMGGEMFYWAVTRIRPAAGQRFIFFTGCTHNPKIEFFFRRVNATVLFKPFKLSQLDSAIKTLFRKLG
jgi:CheY-like chemotaxis protein